MLSLLSLWSLLCNKLFQLSSLVSYTRRKIKPVFVDPCDYESDSVIIVAPGQYEIEWYSLRSAANCQLRIANCNLQKKTRMNWMERNFKRVSLEECWTFFKNFTSFVSQWNCIIKILWCRLNVLRCYKCFWILPCFFNVLFFWCSLIQSHIWIISQRWLDCLFFPSKTCTSRGRFYG